MQWYQRQPTGNEMIFLAILAASIAFGLFILCAMFFRTVVKTNDVHIVQSARHTISYGKGETKGNVYYHWPSWLPVIGVRVIVLPVSVFSESLSDYAAYDIGRLPFKVDVMAFFRIKDSNMAAQRVSSFAELQGQLKSILQGAIRSILASADIETILSGRREFGHKFTEEVEAQLVEWGVTNVKTIELMDIRDADGSKVIANIMAKQKSVIDMQSRVTVANNMQTAEIAEVEARRNDELQQQEAVQQVGIRTEQAKQNIKEQAKVTADKEMNVQQVMTIRQAEITKDAQVILATQEKEVTVIAADADLQQAKKNAEDITVEGKAKGEAETAILMAPVTTQITLAKEIGENSNYQTYLIGIQQIDANKVIGIEAAKALQAAGIKVIVNSGDPNVGVKNVMDLFTPKGGMQLGAMLESLQNTDAGKAVVAAVTGQSDKSSVNGTGHV